MTFQEAAQYLSSAPYIYEGISEEQYNAVHGAKYLFRLQGTILLGTKQPVPELAEFMLNSTPEVAVVEPAPVVKAAPVVPAPTELPV